MAEGYLVWNLLILEERIRIMERKIERRLLHDAQNPLELLYNEFHAAFRVNKELLMNLTNILRPHLQPERRSGLALEIQVLVAIQFFANENYQRPAGNQCEFALSQPSTSRCIRKVTRLINIYLLQQWIKFPITQLKRTIVQDKFVRALQPFPGAIGAINCTYINNLVPRIHEEAYVNHHGNHSLNVQTWGMLKNTVYNDVPTTQENMRERILNACGSINSEMIERVRVSFVHRIRICIEVGGHHFEHLLK
ncbi:Putative nuclease HARBI1 [Ooceraea biroi]|uniref:Putative nuclease HARBI1 n=1 Tax=Ooceraea biroi TaxID=2015173 RepID=A0A026WNW0_OOCBI|nr:Putative nuclease HARBI1 [Ooceraea biroi]